MAILGGHGHAAMESGGERRLPPSNSLRTNPTTKKVRCRYPQASAVLTKGPHGCQQCHPQSLLHRSRPGLSWYCASAVENAGGRGTCLGAREKDDSSFLCQERGTRVQGSHLTWIRVEAQSTLFLGSQEEGLNGSDGVRRQFCWQKQAVQVPVQRQCPVPQ